MDRSAEHRRLAEAAGAVLDEWDAHRADLLLGRRMDELRAALRPAASPPRVEWVDRPGEHQLLIDGRHAGVIQITADGLWLITRPDNFSVDTHSGSLAGAKAVLLREVRPAEPENRAGAVLPAGDGWWRDGTTFSEWIVGGRVWGSVRWEPDGVWHVYYGELLSAQSASTRESAKASLRNVYQSRRAAEAVGR